MTPAVGFSTDFAGAAEAGEVGALLAALLAEPGDPVAAAVCADRARRVIEGREGARFPLAHEGGAAVGLAATLLLWGAEDRLIPPAAGERFAEALANADLVVVAGLGHVSMTEDPEATLAVLRDFLARAAPRE